MYLILIRGLPGSGKSTLTRKLIKKMGGEVAHCSTDDVVTAGGVYLWSPDYIGLSHKINQMKVREACKRGIPVIVDNTNTTWKEIEPYWNTAQEFGYKFIVEEPDTEWKFDVDKCAEYNSHGVPKETIQRMLDRWESTASILEKI